MDNCNFCGREHTTSFIFGGIEDSTSSAKQLEPNTYKYACCYDCWDEMKHFVLLPRNRILKQGIF